VRFQTTVGIGYDHDTRRMCLELPNPPIKSVSFAELFWIVSLDDFRACGASHLRCIVSAVIRNNEQTITWSHLRLSIPEDG
jgi:hypothetical protein